MISRYFIDRPIFAWVIAITIMLAGALAIHLLPLTRYPTVAPPSVSIFSYYPGANAQTLENSVTQVIEQQLTEVTVDPSSGSVTLRARFPNPDGLLLPGMYVRAVVTEGATPDGILVPQAAIIRDRRGTPQARLVTAENKLELRNVVVARSVGQNWLVSEGLKPGDRLVMAGGQNVQPGTTVKALDEPPAATAPPQNGTPVAAPGATGPAGGNAPAKP